MLRVLDLFSGIGGFSLGLERTGGFQTVAFCEIDPFCRRVLAKHWPEVPIYEDVCELTADTLSRDGIAVDAICGGFPCQDVSQAGKRTGLEGARSGLWSEYGRLVGELRPRYVIVENVPGLLSLGMGNVLGDLAALGYDAVWDCIPAAAVGAPHQRDRVWIVAYPQQLRSAARAASEGHERTVPHKDGQRARSARGREVVQSRTRRRGNVLADADSDQQYWRSSALQVGRGSFAREAPEDGDAGRTEWRIEPDVGRVAHGIPSRVDRLRSLGNAVVPQIPELIGHAILQAHGLKSARVEESKDA